MEEIKEVSSISFGISSVDEIRNKSVYVANVSKYGENKQNTVYDHRSGALFNKRCETCKEYEQKCPGHFGHIELNATIVNPIFEKDVFNVLKVICHACSKLLLTREHLQFGSVLSHEGDRRLNEIDTIMKNITSCFHCNEPRREYKMKKDVAINSIYYIFDDKSHDITDLEIKEIFEDIDTESLDLLNIDHPKKYCIDVFPVIPPCCRPYDFVGNTIKEDDLTKQLVEIIKYNNLIPTASDKNLAVYNLKIKIETFCRPPKKNIKCIQTEAIKGIRDRLTGKDGQLRDNLMGKRTEMSSRTVIGPGPHLKFDEVGIPESVANSITFPIDVCEKNIEEVKQLINSGLVEKLKRDDKIIHVVLQRYANVLKFIRIGDVIVRNGCEINVTDPKIELYEDDVILRNGQNITPANIPTLCELDIRIGDIAQRKILNGDWVLMNRQPTLWKGSMMAFKAVISTCGAKTFMFNPAVCKAFNSDFDGDEQNAHFPQSLESSIEISLLSTPQECLLSSTNGTPIIVILQDALLGAYLMSKEDSIVVDLGVYNDIIMCLEGGEYTTTNLSRNCNFFLHRKKEIRNTLINLGKYNGEWSLRTGRSILSLILPNDFNLDNEDLKIKNGVIYEGNLTKKYLGSSHSSIIYMLKSEYNTETCANFINEIQFMTNKWLTYNSFSVHVGDCAQNKIAMESINEKLEEAEFITNTIMNKKLVEAKINLILSNAKDIGMKIAENSNNNFVTTIKAGSKGDYFNLGQVKGLLGQQIINGGRIKKQLDNNTRTMVHYPRNNASSLLQKYESRGFIMNSFSKGLNPQEFFFHSMSGRQGVCDTAMTTYRSGYIMRKIIKNTEDIKIQNDGSVMDSYGNLYSHSYGDIGLNPETACHNISRIVDRINNAFISE